MRFFDRLFYLVPIKSLFVGFLLYARPLFCRIKAEGGVDMFLFDALWRLIFG